MIRGLLKTAAASALHWTGGSRLLGSLTGTTSLPMVLGYHRVVENFDEAAHTSIPSMLISKKMLEKQLDWVGRRYRYVTLDEIGDTLRQGRPFERPVAAVTFDDGYRDVYEHAFPMLRRKGIPAAVFVVTDLISTTEHFAHDRLYFAVRRMYKRGRQGRERLLFTVLNLGFWGVLGKKIKELTASSYSATQVLLLSLPQSDVYRVINALEAELSPKPAALHNFRTMTWEMLAEMHQAGIAVASHTRTHPLLPNENAEKCAEEIAGSRRLLQRKLGLAVRHFAYPAGQFTRATVEAVAGAGYEFGYTCCRHRDASYPLLTVPRKVLWQNSSLDALGGFSSSIMSCHVNSVFDLVARCDQYHNSIKESPAAFARRNVA